MSQKPENDSPMGRGHDRPQFSLLTLLLVLVVVGVYLALAMAAFRNHGELLDTITDRAGVYGVVCLIISGSGLCMMVGSIALGQDVRGSTCLFVVAISYATGSGGVFFATLVVDAFAIFSRTYMLSAVFAAPAVMIVALLLVTGFCKRLAWLALGGFVVWISGVGFAHLWIIAAASASV